MPLKEEVAPKHPFNSLRCFQQDYGPFSLHDKLANFLADSSSASDNEAGGAHLPPIPCLRDDNKGNGRNGEMSSTAFINARRLDLQRKYVN
jgi:hypothetical protein